MIGIGVGAAAFIIALATALVVVCYRLRALRTEKRTPPVISKPLYCGSSVQLVDDRTESAMRALYEKESRASLRELGSDARRHEMSGRVRSARYELGS